MGIVPLQLGMKICKEIVVMFKAKYLRNKAIFLRVLACVERSKPSSKQDGKAWVFMPNNAKVYNVVIPCIRVAVLDDVSSIVFSGSFNAFV
ncbi:hypothetical protein VNO78_25305 [Psophocarpus tetragonolobus]|uniref:Uncharacterized protein n=1 Tax=Psophocarpus tetragonolobus TaxID=3891 RepID=A0AAN9S685_PSOTE